MINVNKASLKDLSATLKVARMNHSMIVTTESEKGTVLVVGGEDGSGALLDSCEIYKRSDPTSWKPFASLNNRGKNVGLCKFSEDATSKGPAKVYIYAFTRNAIERVDLGKQPAPTKWEELNIKISEPLPISTNCL